MKRTRKKTTKQETLQQPTVAITMTAEDKAAAEKVAALREAEAAQKAREDAIEATYRKRFDRHFEELRWLYMELYGNSSMFAELCDNMKRFYMERNTDLRASDASREKRPDWYKQNDMMGMMFYIDNFAGNMKGVQKKLDYIEQCGVNYIHLMPFLDTPEGRSDGGYAVSDFRKVQEKLGTMEDLEHLTAACHEKDINVCMDFVMNHTSEDHEWAKRARQGDGEYMGRYFFFDNWDIPAKYEQTVPQVFPTTAPGNFTWLPDAGHFVMTSFYPYQWDLNYRNPRVFNEMMYNFLFLANKGIDIVRIDAVPYIWKELGTTCRNLQQVHTIVRMMRMIGEIVCPGILLLGEVVMEPEKVVPYFGTPEKPECHMLYNVTTMATIWNTVATKDTRLLEKQLDSVYHLPGEYTFLNYLRCHDDIGWGLDYDSLGGWGMDQVAHKQFLNDFFTGKYKESFSRGVLYNDDPVSRDARFCGTTASMCGIEEALEKQDEGKMDQAIRLDLMLHGFMLQQSGIPVIYSGDEVGALNDNHYKEDPEKAEDSRYIHRGQFDWKLTEKIPQEGTVQNRIFYGLRRMEEIRMEHEVFSSDALARTMDMEDDSILGILRTGETEEMLGVYNFSDAPKKVSLQETWTDLLNDETYDTELSLKPYDFRWMIRK